MTRTAALARSTPPRPATARPVQPVCSQPGTNPIQAHIDALIAAYADRPNFACPYEWARAHPVVSGGSRDVQLDANEDREGDYR